MQEIYNVKPNLLVLLDKKVCKTKTTGFGHPCKSSSLKTNMENKNVNIALSNKEGRGS